MYIYKKIERRQNDIDVQEIHNKSSHWTFSFSPSSLLAAAAASLQFLKLFRSLPVFVKSACSNRFRSKMFIIIMAASPTEPNVNQPIWTRDRLRTIHLVIQHRVRMRNKTNEATAKKKKDFNRKVGRKFYERKTIAFIFSRRRRSQI